MHVQTLVNLFGIIMVIIEPGFVAITFAIFRLLITNFNQH